MPQAVHVFCGSIGGYDAEIVLEVAAGANRFLQHFFEGRAILRMNPVHKHRVGRRGRFRVQSEDPKMLGRPRHLAGGHAPGPAASSADSLAFGEKSLTPAQLLLTSP